LSITLPKAPGKPNTPVRLRPNRDEGLFIQYNLKRKKYTLVYAGSLLGVTRQAVARVVYGQCRSPRIESEIARLLGKKSWNDVVLEARSEVQKKPVNVIIKEMNEAREIRAKAQRASMGAYAEENRERVEALFRNAKAGKAGRRA
jgi:hypothetical protein